MKALICALNTKYVHSSLAPWCLKAGAELYSDSECTVYESTVNEDTVRIFRDIMSHSIDLVAFCVYIWNKEKVLTLCRMIKERRDVKIVLGGPEVSYNASEILNSHPCVDYIITGEGEEPFGRLVAGEDVRTVPALVYREKGRIVENPSGEPLSEPPCPYTDGYFEALKGRIAYIETSRGCPFSCAFCLSGRCGGVRFFNVERAKENIIRLANSGAKTVKLVDRTFNADRKRARELFSFIIDNYGTKIPEGVCFHFELEGELIDEPTLEILARAPRGAIQVEIGLQTFNTHTLEAINRKANLPRLCENIRKIIALGNIHTHIDLIAGLPYEDIESLENSFNRALELKPHMLQLGFLKLLHGSKLRENLAHVYDFDENPPYEVISTPYLSKSDLALLHKLEDVFERTYNSLRFPETVKYLHTVFENHFRMYKDFALYVNEQNTFTLDDFTLCLYNYFASFDIINKEYLRDTLALDRLSTNRMGALPDFLKVRSPHIKRILNELEKNADTGRRAGVKRAATVLLSTNDFIYVDYRDADPVTGRYMINRIKLEGIL